MITRNGWRIFIKRHAYIRAIQRAITPDMIEVALKGGKIEYFGKNYLRFIKEYKRGKVVCVGEKKTQNEIHIFTVEWR